MTPDQEYIDVFTELAEATAPKCAGCRAPFSCCSAQQCEDTRRFAKDTFGVDLEETGGALPFIGPNGCTVAPHLRPMCSVHVCDKHLEDPEYSEIYFEIRERAGEALFEVMLKAEAQTL